MWDKIETVAREIYGAATVTTTDAVRTQIDAFEAAGFGDLPVCMAKTPLSFSDDPKLLGAPEGHDLTVRVRLSAGAGFMVAICGSILTMPGLPRIPAANNIDLNENGQIEGLF